MAKQLNLYNYDKFVKLGITDAELQRHYKSFTLNDIKKWRFSRYQMVWIFIKLKCNTMSSYGHVYIVADWNIAENMKKALNLPTNYKYFTLKHMYEYVDHQLKNEKAHLYIMTKPIDDNGLVDYFNIDYKPDAQVVMT